ncbi:hypothetical protein [Herbaspirillum rubrisubalbicans]|uniref:hypothetical protein n=1 Tax=Herbaspirillum rubrisubalbicans TaxID=80842 RepID=UPI0015C54901|nr:hypothetical protein [Herbaspirillum rubrisubalbicans]NQE51861.1 hypothetical protein [Herbaspirillum rubrisubalbicans]
MDLKTLVVLLNIATAIAAIVSAFCWQRSCTVSVPHAHAKKDGIFHDGTICVDGNDFLATAKSQANWNRRAAFVACFAALFQAGVAGISAFQ